MHALLLIAHGSRRAASNCEVRELAEQVGKLAGDQFACVSCAFLELAEPDIASGIEQSVANGATEITVVPYFLSAGRHVAEDIPREVNAVADRHSGVKVNLCRHIGAGREVPALLLRHATE